MQTRSSDENSVRPSVRLSVKRVNCDKWEERSYERSFSLVFWEEKWLVKATPSTWNFGSTGPHWSKIADFEPIIARSASAVTPSEKSSINANMKPTTRFSMNLRWSSYVTYHKGRSKTQCPKFQQGSITPKPYEIGYQLLLITNRKSNTGFRLVSTSMT